MSMASPADIALASLATLRLTRFITTDTLGDWWVVRPVKKWAARHDGLVYEGQLYSEHKQKIDQWVDAGFAEPAVDLGWRSKLASGLECPFCVGFWIGAFTLGTAAICNRSPRSRSAFRFAAGSLGMNYVAGHIGSRLD